MDDVKCYGRGDFQVWMMLSVQGGGIFSEEFIVKR